jgi:hypothetical protein
MRPWPPSALPAGALSPQLAALALATPVLFNTMFKAAILIAVAGWRRRMPALLSLAAAAAALLAAILAELPTT